MHLFRDIHFHQILKKGFHDNVQAMYFVDVVNRSLDVDSDRLSKWKYYRQYSEQIPFTSMLVLSATHPGTHPFYWREDCDND